MTVVPKVADEAEFERLMKDIDAKLIQANEPIHARQILALADLSKRFGGVSITVPRTLRKPSPGSFEGEDLILRALIWMKDRYGARLANTDRAGYSVTIIKGDPFRISVPHLALALQTLKGIALDWSGNPSGTGTEKNEAGDFIWHVGQLVEHLTQGTISALTNEEKQDIASDVRRALDCFGPISRLYDGDYGSAIRTDLRSAVDTIMPQPDYGQSRWNSLQAAEKSIKKLLKKNGIAFPTGGRRGHDLHHLAGLAAGFVTLDTSLLGKATCSPQVRYGEIPSSLAEARDAHNATITLCARVGAAL
jgi:hypothetical protein